VGSRRAWPEGVTRRRAGAAAAPGGRRPCRAGVRGAAGDVLGGGQGRRARLRAGAEGTRVRVAGAGAGGRRCGSWLGRARLQAGAGGRGRGQTLARADAGVAAVGRALLLGQRDWSWGFYLPLPHHGSWRGTATPRLVARQALPRHRSSIPVVATSAHCRATMHGAAQAFSCAIAIGAAKSVSLKKQTVLDL